MRAGWRAGVTSGRPGTRTSWLVERNGRLARPHQANRLFPRRRRLCPTLSLLPPVSRGLQCSPPRSSRPMHHLNLVRCGLLLPICGDALFSAVVPLSREVWNLQKSHAHPCVPLSGSEAFFRVDTCRVRRSGSRQPPFNAEAAPVLLSTDFCLTMSRGLIPV